MKSLSFEINSSDYKKLVKDIYKLIDSEYNRDGGMSPERIDNLKTMYKFFRLLRGEAFTDFREPVSDFQKEMYRMEDELSKRLDKLVSQ